MTPCSSTCPAGDCANCVRFDRLPATERPHCVPVLADMHAGMDDTAAWAERVARTQQKVTGQPALSRNLTETAS